LKGFNHQYGTSDVSSKRFRTILYVMQQCFLSAPALAPEPQIRSAAPAPAPAPDSFIRYIKNNLF